MHTRYRGSGKGYTGGAVDINAGPSDGMIRTQQDLDWVQAMIDSGYSFNGVKTLVPDQLWYGDFIYADHNGDGNYGNEDDKVFNGHTSTPSYNLGINLGFSWKGLSFSMIWSGAFDYWLYWAADYYNTTNVTWGYAISRRIADNHYFYNPSDPSDSRTNTAAAYPRLFRGSKNRETSDFYEYRADYLKLKNIQVGYTVPQKWTNKFFVKELRFYASGENLLTVTKFPGMDPELGTSIGYPLMRQVSIGAQIIF